MRVVDERVLMISVKLILYYLAQILFPCPDCGAEYQIEYSTYTTTTLCHNQFASPSL